MPKSASSLLSKELLEQIYSEIETRVSRKFESRIRDLEKRLKTAEIERDAWRKRFFEEQQTSRHLQGKLELAQVKIKELERLAEKQAAQIDALQKQLHGKKSEVVAPPQPEQPKPKRSRGKQDGEKGYGRKDRQHLEAEDCPHNFSDTERRCPKCGLLFEIMGEKISEQIHVEYKVVRKIHRRQKIVKACTCASVPTIRVAPGPEQLFKGSIFSIETWSHVIFDKYFAQRPTHRTLGILETFGLEVSQGTFTNGFKKLHENQVFKPLIDDIKSRILASPRQQKDETGWKVFQEIDGKKGYAWWLWLTRTETCALFQVDPSRSREVAKQTIGQAPVVVLTDCFSAYSNLGDNVVNAWCWAHIRRALLKLSSFGLKPLADAWVARVDFIYHLNHQRLNAPTEAMFRVHEEQLVKHLADFERLSKRNAVRHGMHEEAQAVFNRIAKHWDGLTVFVGMPAISMDNNLAEQALRNPVVGRKCYYGSGSHWSAQFAADLFTIFETLRISGINPRIWLTEYLYALARNNCHAPHDAASFLPWNTPPADHLLA